MTTSPTCIIAFTAEDDRYQAVREKGEETAQAASARLVLYDIDAAGMFSAPLPTEWSGEGAEDLFGDMLLPDDLERAGRHTIAQQVKRARADGIDAYGWLPSKKGADGLAEYADLINADLILLPADESPSLLDRLRGATIDDAVEKVPRPIALVDEDGALTYPEA